MCTILGCCNFIFTVVFYLPNIPTDSDCCMFVYTDNPLKIGRNNLSKKESIATSNLWICKAKFLFQKSKILLLFFHSYIKKPFENSTSRLKFDTYQF